MTDDHRQCIADHEALMQMLTEQLPPCPGCGCRTMSDPDRNECGCDMGCNDSIEYPPGVTVLLAQARDQSAVTERERMQHRVNALLARHNQLPVWLRREIAGLLDGDTDGS